MIIWQIMLARAALSSLAQKKIFHPTTLQVVRSLPMWWQHVAIYRYVYVLIRYCHIYGDGFSLLSPLLADSPVVIAWAVQSCPWAGPQSLLTYLPTYIKVWYCFLPLTFDVYDTTILLLITWLFFLDHDVEQHHHHHQ